MTTPDAPPGHPAVLAALDSALAEHGRISFADYMQTCLYHPEGGYYLQPDRRPGRAGDFLTAPEAHPFFGMTLARQVAECWERLGRPARFDVREHGAGSGALAFDILNGIAEEEPDLLPIMRYRLAEANPHRREEAVAALAESGFGEHVIPEDPDGGLDPIEGVVLANEVADALPVHRLVLRDGVPRERWVVRDGDGGLAFEEGDLSPEMAAFDPAGWLARHGVHPADGDAIDLSPASAAWFRAAASGLARGYAIVIDYGYPADGLYRGHRLAGTVRAYRGHTVTDDPFGAPGDEDLTAHVDFTLLREAGEAAGLAFAGLTTQGDMLAALGMGDFLVALGQDPRTPAAEYYAAQAAVLRLIDPGGMGRFGVLFMARDAPMELTGRRA